MKLFGNDGGDHAALKKDREIEATEIRSDAMDTAASEKPKKSGRKRLLIALCAVVLAIGVLLIAYAIWERPPELPAPAQPTATEAPAKTPEDKTEPGAEAPDAPVETPDPGEAPAVEMSGDRKAGVYTMLVVGRDYASNSTDTILLASFDTAAHKIDVVNIPRDTLINIGWASTPKKINAVYPGYLNSGKDGLEGLRTHVKNLLGFDVDCYAVVTLRAVEDAVNAIGGVYFDVPQDMDYDDAPQYFHVHLKKGYQLLTGYETLGVFRYRHGYANGDMDRIKVQQDLMKAIAGQMLSLGNIPNLGEIIDILLKNVDTNLSAANIAWFARQFLQCSMDDIRFATIPSNSNCLIGGVSYVSIDVPAWLDMVNERLNPYQDDVTVSNVNILTSNYSGSSMSSTTGEIAGGEDSFYCLTCTVKNGGKSVYHAPGACPADEPEEPQPPETEPPEETPEPTEEPSEAPDAPPEETPTIEVVVPGNDPSED